MLKKMLRGLNRQLPKVGLPKPTLSLRTRGLMPCVDRVMDSLGIREYHRVTYPVNGGDVQAIVKSSSFWQKLEAKGYEYSCFECVSGKVVKGAKILDIGAGRGSYALLFSNLVGTSGTVYAFEPDPTLRESLTHNVRANDLRNIRIDGRCLSNSSGKALLRSQGWGTGCSTIIERACPNPSFEATVRTMTIDDFCREHQLVPDGMKIDVEGAEKLVLEGATETIKKYRPWILLEFHWAILLPEERQTVWRILTERAKACVILDGPDGTYPREAELGKIPDSPFSHIFVQY